MSQDQPGGSGTGRTLLVANQNVVIDANEQAAATQMVQQTGTRQNSGFLGGEKQGHYHRHTVHGKDQGSTNAK